MTSLDRTASWVIVEKRTGKAVCEVFGAKLIKNLNTDLYKAVPILEWLLSLNNPQA